MIYRKLGRTGERVSAIGLGGFHLGLAKDSGEAVRIVRSAIDRGINFLDNCWDYHAGESERRMGAALRDGYRDQVFLMTKFDGRTKKSTAQQIDESLQRLETDHVDLIQYHENIRLEDPDRFFAPDGPLEALLEAKKAGKIRFIGFTGHKDPLVHLRMLEVAAEHKFRFDTCQMPLNVMDAHFRSFGRQVLPKLVEQGMGVLGMKPMGDGHVLKCGHVTAHRMPALRAYSSDLGGDYRLRKHGAPGPGVSRRGDFPAAQQRAGHSVAGENQAVRRRGKMRAVQNHFDVR